MHEQTVEMVEEAEEVVPAEVPEVSCVFFHGGGGGDN